MLAVAAVCGACGVDAPKAASIAPSDEAVQTPVPVTSEVLAELQPVRVRVHPLTRFERDGPPPKGRLRLVCYLELGDRWGHAGKWLGHVRVELYKPSEATSDTGAGASGGGERQEVVWNIDLADPEKNALAYDWVTRAYRLELVGLPEWAERLARGESREPWATVRAYFLVAEPGGGEKRLEGSLRIRRGSADEPGGG